MWQVMNRVCFFFHIKFIVFFPHVMSRMSSRMGQRIVCFMGIIKEVYNTRKKTSVSIPAPLSSVVRLVHDSPEMSWVLPSLLMGSQFWTQLSVNCTFHLTDHFETTVVLADGITRTNKFPNICILLLMKIFFFFLNQRCGVVIQHLPAGAVHDSMFVCIYRTTSDYGAIVIILIAQHKHCNPQILLNGNPCESCRVRKNIIISQWNPMSFFSHGSVSIKPYRWYWSQIYSITCQSHKDANIQ